MKTPRHAPPVVRDGKTLLPADAVTTAPIAALGLVGGYLTARETGIRPLGGVVLAAAGLYAGRTWLAKGGPGVAAGLGAARVDLLGDTDPVSTSSAEATALDEHTVDVEDHASSDRMRDASSMLTARRQSAAPSGSV